MLVGHLLTSPALVGKVQTGQTALHIKDRVREAKATDNLQRILPAIKTQKEVCYFTCIHVLTLCMLKMNKNYYNIVFLLILYVNIYI